MMNAKIAMAGLEGCLCLKSETAAPTTEHTEHTELPEKKINSGFAKWLIPALCVSQSPSVSSVFSVVPMLLCKLIVAALLFGLPAEIARAADLTLKVIDKEPAKELDASIRVKLQTRAVQLLDGDKPAYEFWFNAELPLQSKPASLAKALDAVAQTTLLGAVSVSGAKRDYKDNELAAGIYTMRLGLQPQDGDHLGTADFIYFAVLIPAKTDTKLDGITTYKALTKASSKDTASSHPVILSLRPAASDAGELPKLVDPAPDHKAIRVKIPAKDDKTSLVFDLVYQGMYKK